MTDPHDNGDSSPPPGGTLRLSLDEVGPGTCIYQMRGALSPRACEEMIRRFEEAGDDHHAGRVGQLAELAPDVKRSTDLALSALPGWRDVDRRLFRSLAGALGALVAREPFFAGPFHDTGYGIQRTGPGEYYHWHVDGGSHDFADRQLVAIWYLNDVPGPGGETEFRRQGVRIRPEAGKLLLFPPFWTHEHRGVTLRAGVKYIATTWIAFGGRPEAEGPR